MAAKRELHIFVKNSGPHTMHCDLYVSSIG
jgi:hypothetical protein